MVCQIVNVITINLDKNSTRGTYEGLTLAKQTDSVNLNESRNLTTVGQSEDSISISRQQAMHNNN